MSRAFLFKSAVRTHFPLIAAPLRGLGIVLLISPLALIWFVHGSWDRYLWLIRQPYPMSQLGSDPFLLALAAALFVWGALLLFMARYVHSRVAE